MVPLNAYFRKLTCVGRKLTSEYTTRSIRNNAGSSHLATLWGRGGGHVSRDQEYGRREVGASGNVLMCSTGPGTGWFRSLRVLV